MNTLAELAGKSTHAFMVDVITEQTERAEKRHEFIQSALATKQDFDATGIGYDADEVHAYMRAKLKA